MAALKPSLFNVRRPARVLLVEPPYRAKYPPLGLMKISTYHKLRGDEVVFHKGTNAEVRDQDWDLIYIATLFTFQWKQTIETIRFYQRGRQKNRRNVRIGGIMATLLHREVENETGITPHLGLWNEVDRLPPDYSLFSDAFHYQVNNASFGYTTRGCRNRCEFCAVSTLEPEFEDFIPLLGQVDPRRKDLILLDNNVLASAQFSEIVREIQSCGFSRGSRFGAGYRYLDFNQGVDLRRLSEEKLSLLSTLPLRPLRIALDNIEYKKLYIEKVSLAARYGIRSLSNYILFNFNDSPDDFYARLEVSIRLNEDLGLSIYSFPMKYVPLDARDRKHVGPHWTKAQLRGVQCILHATRGVVGPRRPFFEAAFGRTADEFRYIIEQPDKAIFYRTTMLPYRQESGLVATI